MVPGSVQPLEVGACAALTAEIHASRVLLSFALFQSGRFIAVTQHLWPFRMHFVDVNHKLMVALFLHRLKVLVYFLLACNEGTGVFKTFHVIKTIV